MKSLPIRDQIIKLRREEIMPSLLATLLCWCTLSAQTKINLDFVNSFCSFKLFSALGAHVLPLFPTLPNPTDYIIPPIDGIKVSSGMFLSNSTDF